MFTSRTALIAAVSLTASYAILAWVVWGFDDGLEPNVSIARFIGAGLVIGAVLSVPITFFQILFAPYRQSLGDDEAEVEGGEEADEAENIELFDDYLRAKRDIWDDADSLTIGSVGDPTTMPSPFIE